MLRTKKQVDRVRLFLRPSSAYFAFGNSIRKDAPKVGEDYKSSSTVVVFLLLSVLSTVLFFIGEVYQNYWNLFKLLYYFSQDHLVASVVAARLLGCLKCWFVKWPTTHNAIRLQYNVRPLNCLKQPPDTPYEHKLGLHTGGSPLSTISLSTIPGIVRFKIVLNSMNSQI